MPFGRARQEPLATRFEPQARQGLRRCLRAMARNRAASFVEVAAVSASDGEKSSRELRRSRGGFCERLREIEPQARQGLRRCSCACNSHSSTKENKKQKKAKPAKKQKAKEKTNQRQINDFVMWGIPVIRPKNLCKKKRAVGVRNRRAARPWKGIEGH